MMCDVYLPLKNRWFFPGYESSVPMPHPPQRQAETKAPEATVSELRMQLFFFATWKHPKPAHFRYVPIIYVCHSDPYTIDGGILKWGNKMYQWDPIISGWCGYMWMAHECLWKIHGTPPRCRASRRPRRSRPGCPGCPGCPRHGSACGEAWHGDEKTWENDGKSMTFQ